MKLVDDKKPIHRLDDFRRAIKMTIANFEKSIGYGYNSFGSALQRGSSINDEAIHLIIQRYPELSLKWLFSGTGNMLNNSTDVVEVAPFGEPNLHHVYELMENIEPVNTNPKILAKLKNEVIRLYSVHLELKKELQKIKDLSEKL